MMEYEVSKINGYLEFEVSILTNVKSDLIINCTCSEKKLCRQLNEHLLIKLALNQCVS